MSVIHGSGFVDNWVEVHRRCNRLAVLDTKAGRCPRQNIFCIKEYILFFMSTFLEIVGSIFLKQN